MMVMVTTRLDPALEARIRSYANKTLVLVQVYRYSKKTDAPSHVSHLALVGSRVSFHCVDLLCLYLSFSLSNLCLNSGA